MRNLVRHAGSKMLGLIGVVAAVCIAAGVAPAGPGSVSQSDPPVVDWCPNNNCGGH